MRIKGSRMARDSGNHTALKWTAGALGLMAGVYASYVAATWLRYGHPAQASAPAAASLLDRFMPLYEAAERHKVRVSPPADVAFTAACEHDLMALPVVRAIFKARELVLGAERD